MDIENVEIRVKKSILLVTLLSVGVPAVYMFWFLVVNEGSISNKTENWGQLGDFIGGFLNPIIAFSAFYWLSTSVLLQKTELADTRKSLEASQKAQEEQAKTFLTSTKLQYINIQLEAINSQILAERAYINQLIQQAQVHGVQYTVVTKYGLDEKLEKILPELHKELELLSSKRAQLMKQAEEIAPDIA